MQHAPSCLLALAVLLVAPLVAAPAAWAQGTAPPDPDNDGVFEVSTTNHLIYLSQNSNADFTADYEQTADISFPADETTFDWNGDGTVDGNDASGFSPIGPTSPVFDPFKGNYDGGGHTISNLYMDRAHRDTGFFGEVDDSESIIKNLGLIDVDISSTELYVGGIAGHNYGVIKNSYVTGNVSGGSGSVGGLVGWHQGLIKNSYSHASVSQGNIVGGLVGYRNNNDVNDNGSIENSYSTGAVAGQDDLGGLIGFSADDDGGFVTNSFWDTETSGQNTSDGGTGKTTAEMKTESTFTGAGWDFARETANGTDDHWGIDANTNNGYPYLTVLNSRPFITTWRTDSFGNVTIGTTPGTGVNYDFTIDWGDGTIQHITASDPTPQHSYGDDGTYTVKIEGTFPALRAPDGGGASQLQSVEQWGTIVWRSFRSAFRDATNVTFNATDTPNLSRVTDMSRAFEGATNLNSDIGGWDVSNVTRMDEMFRDATQFNQDIGGWDVSSVTTMSQMFRGATQFNQDIGGWDVSNVALMDRMFANATQFNQDISGWDVSSVSTMRLMFFNAGNFNQDIGGWNVSNVMNMAGMFFGASAFDQDLGSWDVSSVGDLQSVGGFLEDTALSRANYDALLKGWSQETVLSTGLTLGVGTAKYSPSTHTARANLQNRGWTINDGGRAAALTITGAEGTGNDAGWRMMSFPQAVTLGDIEDNFNFNFQDVTSGAVVYTWDGATQAWTSVDADNDPIAAGEGVYVYFFDDSDDPITSSGFSFSVPGTDSPESDFDRTGLSTGRFVVLGNPYLRPYDLSSLDLNTTDFQQTVQVWDPDQDAFVPRDRSTNETVAGMQGFVAERSTSGTGPTSLTFSAGGTQAGGLGQFIGKSVSDTIQTAPVELALSVTGADGDTLSTDRMTVRFDERAAPGWDAYEATKLTPPAPNGYATLTSPIERAGALTRRRLAAEPFPSGDAAATVPLSARSVGATGTATVRLLDAPDAAGALTLTDTDADTTVTLRSTNYAFALDAGDGQIDTPDEARFQLQAGGDALPVELTDFQAAHDEQTALLTWQTASEQQNAGFAVQHRGPDVTQGDTGAWTRIGFVEGHGTTTTSQPYRFRTKRLAVGTHRFRLKQVDTDGSTTVSHAVEVQIGIQNAYALSAPTPNPTAGEAHVQLTVRETQPVRVAVYDVLGREVRVVFDGPMSAQQPTTLRIGEGLPAGQYFVRAVGERFSATERLTIVR
jgi:surface protein